VSGGASSGPGVAPGEPAGSASDDECTDAVHVPPVEPAGSASDDGCTDPVHEASFVARGERGQSAVETVALLPLYVAAALAIGHVLAAGLAHELAGHAAEAGAIAVLRGGDADEAVRAALPEWSDGRLTIRERGGRVRVRLEPPAVIPGVGRALAATADADAGARAAPSAAAAADDAATEADTPRRSGRATAPRTR
jgi:hypothetical protein